MTTARSCRPPFLRRLATAAIVLASPLIAAIGAGCGGGSPSSADAAPTVAPAPGPSPTVVASDRLLFVLSATRGEVLRSAEGAPRTLRFDGVDASLLAFADRPIRIAVTQPTARLFADWAAYGFAAVPPNAAIVVTGSVVRDPVAIELRNPRYDEASGTLEVEVASLAGDASGALGAVLDESGRDGRTVIVFIDATAAGPVPTSSDSVSAIVQLVEQALNVSLTAEQSDVLANGASTLLAVDQSPRDASDPQLVAQNVELFVDNVQQVLGVSLDVDQRRALTRALVQVVGSD